MNPTKTSPEAPAAIEATEASNATPIQPTPKRPVRRYLQMDENGHAIPPTPEEQAADTAAWLIAMAEMAAIPDDPPGSDEEFWRAIDAGRPDRPLFKELYEK